jgi:O-methyltransferase involved in polyketide biosynthesis
VTQYLTRDAIRTTLRWAGERPKGSEIVLTIVEPGAREEGRAARAQEARREIVEFTSYITVNEMTVMLQEAGFSQIEPLTQAVAEKEYFKDRSDGLVVPQFQRTLAAIV